MKRYIANITGGIQILVFAIGTFHALNAVASHLREGEEIESLRAA